MVKSFVYATRRRFCVKLQHFEGCFLTLWAKIFFEKQLVSNPTNFLWQFMSNGIMHLLNSGRSPGTQSCLSATKDSGHVPSFSPLQVLIYTIIEDLNTWKTKVRPNLNPVKPLSFKNKFARRVSKSGFGQAKPGPFLWIDIIATPLFSSTKVNDDDKTKCRVTNLRNPCLYSRSPCCFMHLLWVWAFG